MSDLCNDNEIIPARFLSGKADRRRGDLSRVFDLVADKTNWKNPINTIAALTFEEADLLREAVPFYTGGSATFEVLEPCSLRTDGRMRSTYRVTAPGYYACIGA